MDIETLLIVPAIDSELLVWWQGLTCLEREFIMFDARERMILRNLNGRK